MEPERQQQDAPAKYRDAVSACESMDYIEYNVSQIARKFGLNGTALANFMRVHSPQTLAWREQMRRWLGLNDNIPRGLLPKYREQYAEAVRMYATSDRSIPEIALACGVSEGGFSQHLRFYHQALLKHKHETRNAARGKSRKEYGELTGNGHCYKPLPKTVAKYAGALELYRTTSLTIGEIARQTSVSAAGFSFYLRKWHRELVLERSGITGEVDETTDLRSVRRRMKIVTVKYAAAIESLRQQPRPVARVAAEFGLQPEVFRDYLHKHEPELARQQGRMRIDNGRHVSRRSEEKYAEAIELYRTTTETLKSIAVRLGLTYNSLSGYVRRNHPEAAAVHHSLLRQDDSREEPPHDDGSLPQPLVSRVDSL